MARQAWGDAIVTVSEAGAPLDFFFPDPRLGPAAGPDQFAPPPEREDPIRAVGVTQRRVVIADLDEAPADTGDAYLRLHLLSHRLARPNSINLDGIFGVLPTVCWTSAGPVDAADARLRGPGGRARGRREPGPPRRPPGRGNHRHARGLRQLQRGYARRLDGRRPDQ